MPESNPMKNRQHRQNCVFVLVMCAIVSCGCSQVVTVYWSKPGAGNAELQRDKDECQSLQRAVGLAESRIEKCLVAKGWEKVRQEEGPTGSDSE